MFGLFCGRLFEKCSQIRLPSILLLGIIYVAYVMAGGAIFWKLEGNVYNQSVMNLQKKKNEMLNKYSCIDRDSIESFAEVLLQASKNGISPNGNHTVDGFWKFTSSAVFAATVVTTIGYGNMSPSTVSGQIFCVLFALFGIPLNLVVLNRIGKYMIAIEEIVCDFIASKINYRRTTQCVIHTLSISTGMVIFFVVPMLLFRQYEGWSYPEAMYYCFITLSTIGFGDYVAVNNPKLNYPEWYADILAAWIFFGLAWLALVINHGMNMLEKFNAYVKDRQNNRKDKEMTEQSGTEVEDTQTGDCINTQQEVKSVSCKERGWDETSF
ncbi:KCNKG protein, partial [Amia calva]|nr:KCNKG protein [Amia calva]